MLVSKLITAILIQLRKAASVKYSKVKYFPFEENYLTSAEYEKKNKPSKARNQSKRLKYYE
jgi:hypothetical protein